MSDLFYDDPLHDAVCTAMVASGQARQALEALAVFLPRYRSLCASLSRRALAHDLFENRDRYDLETLLDRVDREIRAGERIEVHADEHCVSGGWSTQRRYCSTRSWPRTLSQPGSTSTSRNR